jgi:hypothetical protein
METVASYGCDMWSRRWEEKNKKLLLEMDYLRSDKLSRMNRI